MSRGRSSRVAATAVLCFTLAVPVAAFAIVPITPYVSTMTLLHSFRGASRAYSGPAVYITVKDASCRVSGTYEVSLYRDQLVDARIGTVSFNRNGTGTSTWTNVGDGKYYFKFHKADDGEYVYSDKVLMGSQ